MKSLKVKFQNYKKNKSVWGKITDVIFILFIVALFIPNSRFAISVFANRVKSLIIQPSVKDSNNEHILTTDNFNWQLEDMQGNNVNLQEYYGKVIFLNLWATWCGPCVAEMPGIQELCNTFKGNENVKFFLVSNESQAKVKSFIDKREYTFPVFTTRYQSPKVFISQSIPTTFVISKNGIIKIKETGAVNWGGDKMEGIINDLINE